MNFASWDRTEQTCTGRAKKSIPYNLLAITHQRFKLILQYFAGVLSVYITYICKLYFATANNEKDTLN